MIAVRPILDLPEGWLVARLPLGRRFPFNKMTVSYPQAAPAAPNTVASEAERSAMAAQFLKLLDHPRMVVRTLPNPIEIYGEWSDVDDFALTAVRLSQPPEVPFSATGVYAIINPTSETSFLSYANGNKDAKAIADKHIERRTDIYIDIDPTRSHPDGGKVCANDAERQWAEAAMERVVMIAALHGFAQPVIVDSGNGYQVHYKVDLPNDDDSKMLVKSVLNGFATIIDSDQGHIDTSVNNAARLARLPGTWNRKGTHSEERPHRLACIVSAPVSGTMEVIEAETLRQFAARHAKATESKTSNDALPEITAELREQLIDELLEYLRVNGAPPVTHVTESDDKTVISFAHCPFRGPQHTDGAPGILLWKSGSISFHCFHSKCEKTSWTKLQKKLGPLFHSESLTAFALDVRDRVFRQYNDPYSLSQHHLKATRLASGDNSLVYVGGQMYQYWVDRAWQPVVKGELDAPMRQTIQSVFDAYYMMNGASMKEAAKVYSSTITNAIKAIESAVHVPTDPMQMAPFWLTEGRDSNPLNLVIAQNGIVDVLAFAQGKEYFFDRTPELFANANGEFSYDADATEAPEWQGFLDSLEQPDDWLMLLQEMMGYWLAGGYDLQKICMFIGPPRCGKGTIQRVITKLLGQPNVCSPNLEDFASSFGLEQLLGTRLAIVPEAKFPTRDVPQIVGSLKAITGGDLVTVNRKHLKNIPVCLKTKLLLVSNNFIALPDNSKALPVRIVPLRFDASFVGKEDITLDVKLAGELPAILNWSLAGFRRLYHNGGKFTLPESSVEVMEQLLMESAPLQSYLQDACIFDPTKGVYKQSLYENYKKWSKGQDSDRPLLSVADFTRELMTAASQISLKRASNLDADQGTYKVISTPFDGKIAVKRPEVWVGIYCRSDS